MIEIEKSRKKSLEAFKNIGENVAMKCCPSHSQKKKKKKIETKK